MTRASLFEFAGGSPALLALARAHHQRCLDDPVLEHPFSHPGHPEHVERLAGYWAEALGGPPLYSQSCGGHSLMIGIHAGEGGDDDLGQRFVECFVQAMDDVPLPDDLDFRRALRSYMEWAVRDVLAYSPHGSEVPPGMAMPRWSWDGLESTPEVPSPGAG